VKKVVSLTEVCGQGEKSPANSLRVPSVIRKREKAEGGKETEGTKKNNW